MRVTAIDNNDAMDVGEDAVGQDNHEEVRLKAELSEVVALVRAECGSRKTSFIFENLGRLATKSIGQTTGRGKTLMSSALPLTVIFRRLEGLWRTRDLEAARMLLNCAMATHKLNTLNEVKFMEAIKWFLLFRDGALRGDAMMVFGPAKLHSQLKNCFLAAAQAYFDEDNLVKACDALVKYMRYQKRGRKSNGDDKDALSPMEAHAEILKLFVMNALLTKVKDSTVRQNDILWEKYRGYLAQLMEHLVKASKKGKKPLKTNERQAIAWTDQVEEVIINRIRTVMNESETRYREVPWLALVYLTFRRLPALKDGDFNTFRTLVYKQIPRGRHLLGAVGLPRLLIPLEEAFLDSLWSGQSADKIEELFVVIAEHVRRRLQAVKATDEDRSQEGLDNLWKGLLEIVPMWQQRGYLPSLDSPEDIVRALHDYGLARWKILVLFRIKVACKGPGPDRTYSSEVQKFWSLLLATYEANVLARRSAMKALKTIREKLLVPGISWFSDDQQSNDQRVLCRLQPSSAS